MFESVSERR